MSRAPQDEIDVVRRRMGWTVPWYSSGDDFYDDLGLGDGFGLSVLLRDGAEVFRTYYTSGRGVDRLRLDFNLLDLTPYGRQEEWENLRFFTGGQGRVARKTRLLQRSKARSFCVQQTEFPYKYVTVECTVVEENWTPSVEEVTAITSRYLPPDLARAFAEAETAHPAGTFVLFTARPGRWLSFDFADDAPASDGD